MKKKQTPKDPPHKFGHFIIPENTKVVSFSVNAEQEYAFVATQDDEWIRKEDTRIRLTQ